jgi:hypothetical protein
MCEPLTVNIDAHADGYIGQTVSVLLHETDCPDPTGPEHEDHDHEHMEM